MMLKNAPVYSDSASDSSEEESQAPEQSPWIPILRAPEPEQRIRIEYVIVFLASRRLNW